MLPMKVTSPYEKSRVRREEKEMKEKQFKEMIKEIERQRLMTDFKKEILKDVVMVLSIKENGWIGYKIFGGNGYHFKYFYKQVEE